MLIDHREPPRHWPPYLKDPALIKACNESWQAQLTLLDSWAFTAWILLNKVIVFVKGPYYDLKLCSF